MNNKKIKTRFAPSPTGHLHIGNARTALFNFLFARHHNGNFIVRIEDTDRQRSTLEFEDSILEDLKWLGLNWDEKPCRQSERLEIYREFAEKLLKQGKAYKCFCTEERLHELRRKQNAASIPPKYDGKCKTSPDVLKDVIPTIRFKVPEKTIVLEDMVHKNIAFDSKIFGDFIIIGSDGIPTYNFAVVIDDSLLEISHVIRGDDHLSNTPRQILLYEILGFKKPEYAHLPLILGKDSAPLSKRHGQAAVKELRENGFVPDAILNYLCHLGWSPDKEYFSIKEAIEMFSIEKVSKSPSIFDAERLKKFNKTYIEKMDAEYLIDDLKHYFKDVSEDRLKVLANEAKKEAVLLKDIPYIIQPFLQEPAFEYDAKKILNEPYAKIVLNALINTLINTTTDEIEKETFFTDKSYKNIIEKLKQKTSENGKTLFMPIRAALTGRTKGLELEKIFHLLGKDEVLKRLKTSLCRA
ncbi:MAG: glutamate--tRNA ligase [Deltaproteobacteria bacterium]|nr:glutamate--tRNA ligase [Deltaproteobacteria bacterium]